MATRPTSHNCSQKRNSNKITQIISRWLSAVQMVITIKTVTIFSSTVATLVIAAIIANALVITVGIAVMAEVVINVTIVGTAITTRETITMVTISRRQALRTTVLTTWTSSASFPYSRLPIVSFTHQQMTILGATRDYIQIEMAVEGTSKYSSSLCSLSNKACK